jgi:hypothetical protein
LVAVFFCDRILVKRTSHLIQASLTMRIVEGQGDCSYFIVSPSPAGTMSSVKLKSDELKVKIHRRWVADDADSENMLLPLLYLLLLVEQDFPSLAYIS